MSKKEEAKKDEVKKLEEFEKNLQRLEELSSELEKGNISLADAVEKFEEAVKCFRLCQKLLSEAEERVELLLKDVEGNIVGSEPFEIGGEE
ncbi:MAG: exodeoxyribonuclease VII small subunit [Planctomycetota bacterium]|nr:exodeoxyribonuclease VII small subunit [Planctomycetota bacterium]